MGFPAALFCAALGFGGLTVPALAQSGPAGFEVTTHDANMLEIRFHNMPLKSARADAVQSSLALDFSTGVDGTAFDRLAASVPDWISQAYASSESGVIRASRPVTFLSRTESDGFSLRLVANPSAPGAQDQPASMPLRGAVDGSPPSSRPAEFGAIPDGAQPAPFTELKPSLR